MQAERRRLVSRIFFISEGDAETHDSWSGASRSVVVHLRGVGYSVRVGDADLYGRTRLLTALRSFALPMRRWWVRYHLGAPAFAGRSAVAAGALAARRGGADVIMQVGATFELPAHERTPIALYCDSNIELARAARASGHSEAAVLAPRELDEIRAREARVYARASVIFAMSERLRRSFIEDFGIPPERVVTVHCGPSIDVPEIADVQGIRAVQPPTILFVGRDFNRKGGALLLAAFDEVRRQMPDARLQMVGGRPSGRAAVPPGVEFLGFLSRDTEAGRVRLDRAYRGAHAFCVPTQYEPFGTSFVEAMMYGLPCVGPAAWAVPEIIDHARTGLLVPPGDPAALASALVGLLRDPLEAARMGAAGRSRALERFSWDSLVSRISHHLDVTVAAARAARRG